MNSNAISMNNKAVASLPKHLLQFAVDQRYEDYTPVDHAVWRFIMRQNVFFLKEYAHKVYFQGLLDTGISFGWRPRTVSGDDGQVSRSREPSPRDPSREPSPRGGSLRDPAGGV